jgi:hypothetical protein
MIKRILILGISFLMLAEAGCIKDTYEMKKFSKKVHLSPTVAITAINENITFANLVKANDTVVIGQDNFVRIVFREDSIINFKLVDFYNLTDMVTFSKSYTVGEMSISPFYQTLNFTLGTVSSKFSAALKNQFSSLDKTTSIFPPFPSVNLQDNTFPLIPNLEYATFASGAIDITVKNNLPVQLNSGATISLFNTAGHTPVGTTAVFPVIPAGEIRTVTIDLANKYVTNSIIAAIVFPGSPGSTPSKVYIDLNGSGVEMGIRGRDLKVKSGRIKIPDQAVTSFNTSEMVNFEPGNGVEIEKFKILKGNLSYNILSAFPVSAALTVKLPTAFRINGDTIKESKNLNFGSNITGSVSVDNTTFNLNSDSQQPYNRIPVKYNININTNNTFVTFNKDDLIKIDLEILKPEFDYVKGYFGKSTMSIVPYLLDFDIAETLSHITGSFLVSDPSIKLNYSNSFAIPVEISLVATGKRGILPDVNLDLTPPVIPISFPNYPPGRDASGSFTIDKTNSKLPELISMPSEKISFTGSAVMNPSAVQGVRNNYVFGDSRFFGSLELEIPMEFRINNLQFTNTVDNFLIDKSSGTDNPVKPENFNLLHLEIKAVNGFPLGVSMSMSLYNPVTKTILKTVYATDILKPAQIDNNGKVTTSTESSTTIELTRDFFSSIDLADKIIFTFKLNTTNSDTKDVKFYSDYRINFKVALVAKPDILIDLN